MTQKTVIELPQEDLIEIRSTLKKLLIAAENTGKVERPDFLSRKEFMAKARISHNKMNTLLRSGKLNFTRLGPRIISIPLEELFRYQRGEVK